MNFKKISFIIVIFFSLKSFSQNDILDYFKNDWFTSIDIGVQMSGIKSEDFVNSNYSPLIRLSIGKWFNRSIGIQVGYQGRYFNTIADNDKHFYNFYFVEGILDVKNILTSNTTQNEFYELIFHGGFGYFQNKYYNNSTVHGVLGASNNFLLANKINLKIDIGAIIGWDMYQGDQDILPNLSFGLVYEF